MVIKTVIWSDFRIANCLNLNVLTTDRMSLFHFNTLAETSMVSNDYVACAFFMLFYDLSSVEVQLALAFVKICIHYLK